MPVVVLSFSPRWRTGNGTVIYSFRFNITTEEPLDRAAEDAGHSSCSHILEFTFKTIIFPAIIHLTFQCVFNQLLTRYISITASDIGLKSAFDLVFWLRVDP